jgi:sporulation protein YlmC with PRC-barrel domain
MKLLSAVTICCLTAALGVAPVLAQQTATNDQNKTITAQKTANMKFDGQLLRSSNVIGADLYNTKGEDIGQINDVLFDENAGGMTHAILAAGGFLGIGDQLTPVEWNKIETEPASEGSYKFMLKADKTELMKEHSFAQNEWPDFNKGWSSEKVQGKKLVRMSTVDDAKLFDKTGTEIGGIKDVVMDAKSGKIAYAVVSFDDSFINKGDKLTMVPWKLVRQSEMKTPGYVLHANKAKLENATFFAPNEWPNMHDLTWNKQVYDYYAVSPYYWTGV